MGDALNHFDSWLTMMEGPRGRGTHHHLQNHFFGKEPQLREEINKGMILESHLSEFAVL